MPSLDLTQNQYKLELISENLSPVRPVRSSEFLRGRSEELATVSQELNFFDSIPFIYGHRGVGKTSLARTAAQIVTSSDRDHVYVACAPESSMLQVLREIAQGLVRVAMQSGDMDLIKKKLDVEISLTPAIRASFEKQDPTLPEFEDVSAAVRVLKELDSLLQSPSKMVVVIDELEELPSEERRWLAYFIKQIGDQEFSVRYLLVGIAENIHDLVGEHQSVPRYIEEVPLRPLDPQDLMDIVQLAAEKVGVYVSRDVLFRIAIIGNGFPHFAHLIGKCLLIEAVLVDADTITDDIYRLGVEKAVGKSYEELRASYEAATQRGEDYFKHLIWALADSDIVDVRIDEWLEKYKALCRSQNWPEADDDKLRNAIGNFKKHAYGAIVINTPAKYGSAKTRYRYKRFSRTLMRGYVRLEAEHEGVQLGRRWNL